MLDNLITSFSHEGGVRNLDDLIASKKDNLMQQIHYFLIFCKVEGFAPKTIQNYLEILRPFVSSLFKHF